MSASTSSEVPELDSYSELEGSELSEDPVEESVATSVSISDYNTVMWITKLQGHAASSALLHSSREGIFTSC